jgi:UDP-glucuronate 4-epimerase
MKTVCVTGAAGFIGSHLVERLLAQGSQVVGIDNFCDFYDPAIKRANIQKALESTNFKLVEGDIRDPAAVLEATRGCDTVMHLAAMAGVRPSLERPLLYQDVNINGTMQILEAVKKNSVTNLVYASSSSVYGNNKKAPFSEDDRVDNPISVYAASKKACELLCHTYHAIWGLDITCLRFFTVYGPRQRPDLAIHKFSKLALEGKPVPFFGDGSMERDHTYVDDIIQGVTAAIETNPGCGFRIVNIGSDRPIRLDALVTAIEKATGKKISLDKKPVPPGDVRRTWADLTRARAELGYEPKTKLEDGLKTFVEWLKAAPPPGASGTDLPLKGGGS